MERVYGVSFETKDQLKECTRLQEEAAQRDHRKIGREQNLFFFHELSPGSCFFQPKGAHIYNTLMDFIKSEYRKRGYQEVITPNIYNSKLLKISGHLDHYAQNMFSFNAGKDQFVLKPMNCPGHCLLFANDLRSYRDLPLRLADFGVLHRNEYSGGLTRVRRFQQDDAHIFCTPDQIQDEIEGCLDFLAHVYQTFGFTFELVLSTRPDNHMGNLDAWNRAENALEASLNKFGRPWKLNEGDGAFYGPKIDITITDALERAHQCATIQLDFQLPERFQLSYDTGDASNKAIPVIIHRAIFGSVERFIAIVAESFAGKWPFWLSPRQIAIVPVDPVFNDYAESVRKQLDGAGFMVELDLDEQAKMNKKIRRAKLAQFNYILIVGERERSTSTVNVRRRDDKICGDVSLEQFIGKMQELRDEKLLDENIEF